MSDKKTIGYRVCRVQRFTGPQGPHWRFTLPIDTRRFDSAKGAFLHLRKQSQVGFKDNNLWVQEVFSDGANETPKQLVDLGLVEESLRGKSDAEQLANLLEKIESEPLSQESPVPATPVVERKQPDWEKAWGYKKPVLRDDANREPVKAQASWANKRMEVSNDGRITVTEEKPTVDGGAEEK
jgi:hypothetical protein